MTCDDLNITPIEKNPFPMGLVSSQRRTLIERNVVSGDSVGVLHEGSADQEAAGVL